MMCKRNNFLSSLGFKKTLEMRWTEEWKKEMWMYRNTFLSSSLSTGILENFIDAGKTACFPKARYGWKWNQPRVIIISCGG